MNAAASIATQLDTVANHPDLDPTEKVARLRQQRQELEHLTGIADRYLADQQLQREAAAINRVKGTLHSRANANLRQALTTTGQLSPETADSLGLVSHKELDSRTGTVQEAVMLEVWSDEAQELAEAARRIIRPTREPAVQEPSDETPVNESVLDRLNEDGVNPRTITMFARYHLSQPSTRDVYASDDGTVWDVSRGLLHDRIVRETLTGGEGVPAPTCKLIVGAPDAPTAVLAESQPHGVLISVDNVRASLPEYQALVEQNDPEAGMVVHDELALLTGRLICEATDRKLDVTVAGSFTELPVGPFRNADYGITTILTACDNAGPLAVRVEQQLAEQLAEAKNMNTRIVSVATDEDGTVSLQEATISQLDSDGNPFTDAAMVLPVDPADGLVEYENLGRTYDPVQNFRQAQVDYAREMWGDPAEQEATDG